MTLHFNHSDLLCSKIIALDTLNMTTVLNAKYEFKNYFLLYIIKKYSDNIGRLLK